MSNQDKKVTQLGELTAIASGDLLYVVDVSDTTDSENGTSKKIQAGNIRFWAATAAETSAGVTISDYQYEPGNALRYGCTGNGTTDDTTALGRWLTCGEASLTLPAGTYITTGVSLAETSSVSRIQGLGFPVIKRKDSLVSEASLFSVYDENEVTIDGIIFDGNSANQTGTPTSWADVGVIATLTAASNTTLQKDYLVTFNNCQFINAPGSNVAGAGMQSCIISNCRFEEWIDHAVYMSGDSGTARGLGSSVIIDGNLFIHANVTADNGAIKSQNNTKKLVVSNNVLDIGDATFCQFGGSVYLPLEIVVTGNTGQCGHVAQLSAATGTLQDTESQWLFANNNLSCADRAFYLGDTASLEFVGHLHINGGTYRNTAGSFKAFIDARYIDNVSLETSIIIQGVKLVDFAVQQGAWPKKFIMKDCVCDRTYATWFLYIGADDSQVKYINIEGNQFLEAASGQGGCQFAIHDDSTFVFKNNYMNTDGYVQLRDFPKTVIIEGNTFVDVSGLIIDAAATVRSTAGDLHLKDNKMIGTGGASANVRLFDENTSTGCLLDSYNVFCTGNYLKDSTVGIQCIGTGVTTYAGSNIFYSWGNYSTGSTFNNTYPAANQKSVPPGARVGAVDYTITNDTTDRTFDANASSVAELADVIATMLKDFGHA